MRVHVHTKFCFLCVLTFLFPQSGHCHGDGHDRRRASHHGNHTHSDLQISEAPYVRREAPTTESATQQGGNALEEEQTFYIQQLFRRHGQKDRLDFQGFQSLLLSLGLGEVKVVSVDHEDLGHDHVAHLDLLDVQEGLHMHSQDGAEGEEHGHTHPHRPATHRPHTERATTRCGQQPTSTAEHKHHHDEGNAHTDEASRPHRDHEYSVHAQGSHKHADHAHHDHHDHGHDLNRVDQTGTALPTPTANHNQIQDLEETGSTPSPTAARPKKPRKPGRVRGQRGRDRAPSTQATPSDEVADGHHHGHKKKREASGGVATPSSLAHAMPAHREGSSHNHEECLNLTQLLTYYGLSPDALISPRQFTYLCPALLYQIDSRVCIRHYHHVDVKQEALSPPSSVWIWLWGFVSITIISLLSLLGVVLVPILNQSCFKFLLTFLVALAVGTLSGDALLHLLPHSQGQHDHSEDGGGHHHGDLASEFDGVWKGLTALAGIYLLFIIEHCIGMYKHYRDQRHLRKAGEEGKIGRKLSDHKLNRRSDAEWLHLKPFGEGGENAGASCDNEHNDTQLSELQAPDSPTKAPLKPSDHTGQQMPGKVNGHKAKGHGHSHGGNCHSDQEMKDAGIASIAWMVIMGDGMHNFSDGLAIGAAFSANLTGGISTSVAVFCHELPHELGDFAVLLKAGMTVKQAIVYNLLSALMAYVGMLIGTTVGQYTHNVTNWIFAITAGMFLYVALVDMLPEMLHGDSEEHKRCQLGHFVLQNLGMLTGFAIMLLIAIFEDRIVFDFSL